MTGRGWHALIAVFLNAGLFLASSNLARADLVELNHSPSVRPGEQFTITVRAVNRGPQRQGSITVSFPDNPSIGIVSSSLGSGAVGSTSKSPYAALLNPGQMAARRSGGQAPLNYVIAELYDAQWLPGGSHFIQIVGIAPQNRSRVRVVARSTFRMSGGFESSGLVGPARFALDQQGFESGEFDIPIFVPPPPTLPPTSTPTRPPTSTPKPTSTATRVPTVTPTSTATRVVAAATTEPSAAMKNLSTGSVVQPSGGASSSDPAGSLPLVLGILSVGGVLAFGVVIVSRSRSRPAYASIAPAGSGFGYAGYPPVQYPPGSYPPGSVPQPYAPIGPISGPTPYAGPPGIPPGHRVVSEGKSGGMATVYKAVQEDLGRSVALKVLSPSFNHDPSFVQRFQDEARSMAALDHPNIVPVYGMGNANGAAYIAMRWIEGASLQEILHRERRLPPGRVASITHQLASALDYAHARGIVHRDIKPGNVMLEAGDRVTLTDFGIAKVLGASTATRTGMMLGTPAYLAPEQALGSPVGHKVDVYALGVVVYEMLSGRTPFVSDEPIAIVNALVTQPSPPLREFAPDISPAVEAAVMQALVKDPNQRYASAGALAAALGQAVREG